MAKTTFVNPNAGHTTLGTIITAEFLNALNSHRHRGVDADGDGYLEYWPDTGAANAYVITPSPAIITHTVGMPIWVLAANPNTGASTLEVVGIAGGAKAIRRQEGSVLQPGDIPAGLVCFMYGGTYYHLMTPLAPAAGRNVIINGGMDIWQRGITTLTNPATGTYLVDGFKCSYVLGDGTFKMGNAAEVLTVTAPFSNSLLIECTHIETAVAAGEYCVITYAVQGYDFQALEGQTATLSFWVKAVNPGIYCVSFRNSATDKSYVSEFTISQASTWEKKTITLTFNSGGTFLYTSGVGLQIAWALVCGSTYQIATANKNTWQSGGYFATDQQVNGLDNTNNKFWLKGVKLELGPVATAWSRRHFAEELMLCQQLYEQSYPVGVAPGTNTWAGLCAVPTYATAIAGGIKWTVPKRAAPTVVLYSIAGAAAKVNNIAGNEIGTTVTGYSISPSGITRIDDSGSGFTANQLIYFHYAATAEL